MKLPAFLGRDKKEEEGEYYWALVVSHARVTAAIWRLSGNEASVVAMGDGVGYGSEEQLLEAVDKALGLAGEKFSVGEEKEPSEVILGLPAAWVVEDRIESEKLTLLRRVLKELDLVPVGFVVTGEAVWHYMEMIEGKGGRVILVGVDERRIEVGLILAGKLLGVETVERSGLVPADVIEGLGRFELKENMPARIVVYDGGGSLAQVRQLLLAYAWQDEEQVRFLHFPKVEVLAGEAAILGVAMAGSTELGEGEREQVDKEGKEEKKLVVSGDRKGGEVVEQAEEADGAGMQDEVVAVDIEPGELGFSETDVAAGGGEEVNLGLAEGGELNREQRGGGEEREEREEREKEKEREKPRVERIFNWGGQLKVAVVIFLVMVGLLVAGVAWWWYWPKAVVQVWVEPKVLEETVTVDLSGGGEGERVAVAELTEEMSGDKSMVTTGTKLVGEKARGEVTLYNRVEKSRVVEKGTAMVGPSGLKFTIDEEVKLASASAGDDYQVIPGKAVVGATAADIGANYNLAGGSEFNVGVWAKSDLVARSDSAFSGGSSREVQAVSEADRERLKASLKEELAGKVKEKLRAKLSQGESLIEETLEVEEKKVSFSGKAGEEAEELSLNLTVLALGKVVKDDDLRALVEEKVKEKVPEGYQHEGKDLEFSFVRKGDEGVYEVVAVARLLPKFDEREWAEKIAGKYPEAARQILTSLPGSRRVGFDIKPNLPGKLGTLPHVAGKIKVVLVREGGS